MLSRQYQTPDHETTSRHAQKVSRNYEPYLVGETALC